MPGWKPSETKLPYYHASVTDCMSVAACCIRNTVGLRRWISTCSDPIRLSHTHTQQKSPLSVSNLMGPLPYIWLGTEESATAKCGALVKIHHIYFIHPLKSLQYCPCFLLPLQGVLAKRKLRAQTLRVNVSNFWGEAECVCVVHTTTSGLLCWSSVCSRIHHFILRLATAITKWICLEVIIVQSEKIVQENARGKWNEEEKESLDCRRCCSVWAKYWNAHSGNTNTQVFTRYNATYSGFYWWTKTSW